MCHDTHVQNWDCSTPPSVAAFSKSASRIIIHLCGSFVLLEGSFFIRHSLLRRFYFHDPCQTLFDIGQLTKNLFLMKIHGSRGKQAGDRLASLKLNQWISSVSQPKYLVKSSRIITFTCIRLVCYNTTLISRYHHHAKNIQSMPRRHPNHCPKADAPNYKGSVHVRGQSHGTEKTRNVQRTPRQEKT